MPQQITVFLFVAIMQKWYECRVNRSMNFQSVFTALIEMNAREDGWQFAQSRPLAVYEYARGRECDTDISLSACGVMDGMSFLLF